MKKKKRKKGIVLFHCILKELKDCYCFKLSYQLACLIRAAYLVCSVNWKLKVDSGPIEANVKTPDDRYFNTEPLENS